MSIKEKLESKVPSKTTPVYYYLYTHTPTLFIWTTYLLILWLASKPYENSEESFLGIATLIVPLVLLQLPKAFYESQIAAIDTIKDKNNDSIDVESRLGKKIINLERTQLAFSSLFSTFVTYVVLLPVLATEEDFVFEWLCSLPIFIVINILLYYFLKSSISRNDKKLIKKGNNPTPPSS